MPGRPSPLALDVVQPLLQAPLPQHNLLGADLLVVRVAALAVPVIERVAARPRNHLRAVPCCLDKHKASTARTSQTQTPNTTVCELLDYSNGVLLGVVVIRAPDNNTKNNNDNEKNKSKIGWRK